MAVTRNPSVTGANALQYRQSLDYSPDTGEVEEESWRGDRASVATVYTQKKRFITLNKDMAGLSYSAEGGRATLVARYVRGTASIDELYGVDVVEDIRTAPYFDSLTDAQCQTAVNVAERGQAAPGGWSTAQKKLHQHWARGSQSYFRTGFVFRRSTQAMANRDTIAAFTGINTVVTAPASSGAVKKLLAALPEGEWLYKPPQAEYVGRGRWRITQEWHWAVKWSVVYGGTW
jgi:hypothetical protein